MVLLNAGLNRIRDLVSSDVYSGVAGTDSTTLSVTHTTLAGEVTAVEDTQISTTTSAQTLTTTATMASGEGNGYAFNRWGVTIDGSGGTLLSEFITADVNKTNNIELNIITTIYFDR